MAVSMALIRIMGIYYTQQSLSLNALIMVCLTRGHAMGCGFFNPEVCIIKHFVW